MRLEASCAFEDSFAVGAGDMSMGRADRGC
jgi:hypothetical protein